MNAPGAIDTPVALPDLADFVDEAIPFDPARYGPDALILKGLDGTHRLYAVAIQEPIRPSA